MGEDPIVIEMLSAPYGQDMLLFWHSCAQNQSEAEEKDNMHLAVALENRRPLDVDFNKGVEGRD